MHGRQTQHFGIKDRNDSVKESIWLEKAVNDKSSIEIPSADENISVSIDLKIREIETRYWIKRKL